MSHGRPPSEDIRKHFEKVTEVDEHGWKTPRQKCSYCGNDIVNLIDRLKDHLVKCKSLPEDLKDSLSFISSKNQTNISDQTSLFIHSKLRTYLNNDRVKKLVALYQEIREDIWSKDDEN